MSLFPGPAHAPSATPADPQTLDDILASLSDAQREAVLHGDGPLAVLAGPGAGKTRVIVSRVARLALPEDRGGLGARPESVLALAFTIKSAEEMRERLAEPLGLTLSSRLWVGTSHSFGRSIVRRFGDILGLPPRTRVMDSATQRRLLRSLAIERRLFRRRRAENIETLIEDAVKFIGACQNAAVEPAAAEAWCEREAERLAAGDGPEDDAERAARLENLDTWRDMSTLFRLYDAARLPEGRLTLDDYIALPVRLLRMSEHAAAILRGEIRHVVVDEFQDWNPAQLELLTLLAPESSGGASGAPDVCVVGDDDQSIYAFRGADDRAFQHFRERWPSATVVRLDLNYRSAAPVVEAARAVIEGAEERFDPDKTIRASQDWTPSDGSDAAPGVEGVIVEDDAHLGQAVGAVILTERQKRERPWSDYAVLARSGATRDAVATALETLGIPTVSKRRATPLDDPAVRALIAWMRLLAGDQPDAHAQRLLASDSVGATFEQVSAWRAEWANTVRLDPEDAPRFADWLAETHADDEAVARFAAIRRDLGERVADVSASAAALEIIRGAALVHAGAPTEREREDRIARLGHVRDFIEQTEPDLDPPADLRAFLEHYNDLSDDEQAFSRAGDDAVDRDPDDAGRPDAVAVLTAHSAKGLEFDTVFVARCRPGRAGFPSSNPRDEPAAPDELTGREPGSEADEERRLFYVACTRAERRLVLLAKRKKSRGKSTDYFIELEDALGASFPVLDAADWHDRAGVPLQTDHETARTALDAEASRARLDGALALHDAERAGLTQDALAAINAQLAGAAERLAILAHLRETGEPNPAITPTQPARAERYNALAARAVAATRRTLEPPFTLSYSFVDDYHRCPACFYVKRVLGFGEPSSPQLALGSAVHAALERFYLETRDADADGRPAPGLDRLLALGDQALRQNTQGAVSIGPDTAGQVRAQLESVWENLHTPNADILYLEGEGRSGERVGPFPYTHNGVEHTFIAKLDRVDRLAPDRFRIIDYKTGAPTKRILEPKKDDLQLSVYAMALQRHLGLEEPPAGVAEYWVAATGERGAIDLAELDLAKATKKIDEAIEGVLNAEFPRGGDYNCRGLCDLLRDSD